MKVQNEILCNKKCRRRDLNPHRFLHTHLKRTCLPFHHFGIVKILPYYYSIFNGTMHSAVDVSSRETLSSNDTQSFSSAEYHFGIVKNTTILFNFQWNYALSGGCFLKGNPLLERYSIVLVGRVPLRHKYHGVINIVLQNFYMAILNLRNIKKYDKLQ